RHRSAAVAGRRARSQGHLVDALERVAARAVGARARRARRPRRRHSPTAGRRPRPLRAPGLRLMSAPAPVELVAIDGLTLRVSSQARGRPLIFLNGIGASLELFAPFRARLEDVETVAVDLPGTGGSDTGCLPRRLGGLALLLGRLLAVLGYGEI